MKNSNDFGVLEMNFKQLKYTNGGGVDPNGCSGCSAGLWTREVIKFAFSFNFFYF